MLIHIYLLQKDQYVAVLNKKIKEYNIYDISNDNWMNNENSKLNVYITESGRSLLVCNKLFVLSDFKDINIYSICNDICHPKLIQTYEIKDKSNSYTYHGMCLFECNELNLLKDGKSIHFITLSIELFRFCLPYFFCDTCHFFFATIPMCPDA